MSDEKSWAFGKLAALDRLNKVGEDEPVFILRAQDALSTEAIKHWIEWAELHPCRVNPHKIVDAKDVLDAFRKWQRENVRKVKVPD